MSSSLTVRLRPKVMAACLLAASLPLHAVAGAAQAASDAPASLRLASAPVARSAQSDCTREASSRGWTVVDTRNMRQAGDGWTMDITVRDRRGRTAEGSCFVETRTGDVTLFGLGWGDEPTGDSVEFKCASVDSKYRECQLPIDGRVELVKKLSDASCKTDKDWGKRGDRVWVNHGCRAKFRVTRSGFGGSGGSGGGGFGGSGGTAGDHGSSAKAAQENCRREAERRGYKVLDLTAASAVPGGYRTRLHVRKDGGTRDVQCTYNAGSHQVRFDLAN
jgi:hypothetical protein